MSVEATLAVIEHAEGTDSEWRMLMLLANEANKHGIVSGVSMDDLSERMGKSTRGAAGVKARLVKSAQLVVMEVGGGRGKQAVYWINLPGLEWPENPAETPQPEVADAPDSPQPDSPNEGQRSIGGTTAMEEEEKPAPKGRAAREKWLVDALAKVGVEKTKGGEEQADDAIFDALDLLRQGRKVDGKIVTPEELVKVVAAMLAWNRCFEWKGKKGSDFGIGGNLKQIVMRIRDRPSWDAAKHVRLVESAWRVRWWERGDSSRRPGPSVIWSPKSFEQVAQDAKDEAGGEAPQAIQKRRYTRG